MKDFLKKAILFGIANISVLSVVVLPSSSNPTSTPGNVQLDSGQLNESANLDEVQLHLKRLNSPIAKTRESATYDLEKLASKAEPAIPNLLKVLKSPQEDPRVRSGAALAIGTIGSAKKLSDSSLDEVVQNLISVLDTSDVDTTVRFSSTKALQKLGASAKKAVPKLKELAQRDDERDVKYGAALALVEIVGSGEESLIAEVLIKELKQPNNEEIKTSAIGALEKAYHGRRDIILALAERLEKDSEEKVCSAAASSLGNIFKKTQDPDILDSVVKALKVEKQKGVCSKIASITVEMIKSSQEQLRSLSDDDLDKLIPLFKKVRDFSENLDSGFSEDQKKVLNERIIALENRLNRPPLSPPKEDFTKQYPWVFPISVIATLGLMIYLGIYWIFPELLIVLVPSEIKIAKLEIPLPLGFFKYPPRALDAWILKRVSNARQRFVEKETVRDRMIYIATPMRLDETEVVIPNNKRFQSKANRGRFCFLIWGESGAGKTSLACQFGRWAMEDDPENRLCKHFMLPVLLEQNFDFRIPEGKAAFKEAARGQLEALIDDTQPISDDLCEHLLRFRRILVIVDRFSEMNDETRKQINPGLPNFSANALVVTSRFKERLDEVPKTTFQPLRVERERLSSFMEAYLTQREKKDLFTDPEYFDACSQLSRIVGERNITVLLAKLYAEQMIARKEGNVSDDLPNNIPDLMLSYLNELNTTTANSKFNDRTVQKDAKIIAWQCLLETYKPSSALRENVINALGENEPEQRISHLEKLRLIQTVGVSEDRIRFALDPLAEYLAALFLVEWNRDDEPAWNYFLEGLERRSESIEPVREFLMALRDCCLAKGKQFKVPDFVVQRLERLINGDGNQESVVVQL
jgi:HEAT repeat protein